MTKIILAASAALLGSLLAVHFVFGADTSDRPARVQVANWIPISDRLGFVVDPPNSSQRVAGVSPYGATATVIGTAVPLQGYFEAKTQTGWRRLEVSQPSDLLH